MLIQRLDKIFYTLVKEMNITLFRSETCVTKLIVDSWIHSDIFQVLPWLYGFYLPYLLS